MFSLTKDTLTIFNVALGNLETLKKSSDFRCPSSFPLYSPVKSVHTNEFISIITSPPVNFLFSNDREPEATFISPS